MDYHFFMRGDGVWPTRTPSATTTTRTTTSSHVWPINQSSVPLHCGVLTAIS